MNVLTILNNKVFQIEPRNLLILEKLKLYLSYKMEGVEYSPAYQNGGWNGMVFLVGPKNQIPLGLLPRTKQWLIEAGEKFELVDQSIKTPAEKPIDLYPRLKELNMSPRPYQETAAAIIETVDRGILRVATGGGKTLIVALMVAKLNKPANVYCIGLDIAQQFHNLFSKLFDEEIGFVGNGICNLKRINIISIWSTGKALNIETKKLLAEAEEDLFDEKFNDNDKVKILKCLKDAKVHILDECHYGSVTTVKAMFKAIEPEFLIGVSGTPHRLNGEELMIEAIWGPILVEVPASKLISEGYLVQPIIKFVDVPAQRASGNYQTIYKEYIVENYERNNLILQNVIELEKKGYKILVLFRQIKHGDVLAKLFKENNISFGLLSGKDSLEIRNEVKDYFVSNKINVILASTIFETGVDIKEISSLILAGGGKSFVGALQRIGRGLRLAPNKKVTAVVDFNDRVKFLKKHSKRRHEIYKSEPGFKVYPSVLKK